MKKVLVVDDDPQVRFLIRTVLESAGYICDEAETGKDALTLYRPGIHNAVILDIIMPDMEGIETLKQLRGEDPAVSVIAVSGGGKLDGAYYLKMMRAFGIEYTFQKPIDPDQLIEAVRKLTD